MSEKLAFSGISVHKTIADRMQSEVYQNVINAYYVHYMRFPYEWFSVYVILMIAIFMDVFCDSFSSVKAAVEFF